MSDIKFFIPKGQTIPTVLELRVDDVSVTYERIKGGFEFCVWLGDRDKAVGIVYEIVEKIKSEHDDPKHFVTWRTVAIDVVEVSEHPEYVRILWKFHTKPMDQWFEHEKAQLSQEGTTKDATFSCGHENDTISRQAAIDACIRVREYYAYDEIEEIKALPPAQPNLQPTDDAAKHLNDLIFDINPAEICSQIESDNLKQWCEIIQTEMKMAMVQLPCWVERRTDG